MPSVASDDGQTDQLHRKFANVIKEHGPLEVTDGHILHLFIQLTAQERKLIMAHGSIKAFVSQSNCIRIDGNTLRLNDSTPLSRFMPTVCSETPKDDSYSPVSTDVSQTPLRVNSPDSVQHSVHNSSEFMLPGNADVFLRTVSPSSSQSSESSLQSTKIFAHQCTEDVHSDIGHDQLESLNCFTGMNSVSQEKVEKSVQTTCRGDDLVEKDDHSSLLIRARQAEVGGA